VVTKPSSRIQKYIVELHQRGNGRTACVRFAEFAQAQMHVALALVSRLATVYLDRRLAVR
jgi:hypothetical protein